MEKWRLIVSAADSCSAVPGSNLASSQPTEDCHFYVPYHQECTHCYLHTERTWVHKEKILINNHVVNVFRGWSPLHYAAYHGHEAVLELLLQTPVRILAR
jgi:hypothetical protein